MKIFTAAVATAFVLAAGPAFAADLITKTSPHSVTETVDRLVAAVEGAGARVFARVDHAAGATAVGSQLRPTQMLMFGNQLEYSLINLNQICEYGLSVYNN